MGEEFEKYKLLFLEKFSNLEDSIKSLDSKVDALSTAQGLSKIEVARVGALAGLVPSLIVLVVNKL
jgi:predicted RecB family endonuclease